VTEEIQTSTPESQDYETSATPDDILEIRTWLRLLTCTTMIERRIRTLLTSTFDTTLPRFDVMAQLEREPEGLTMGQLSRRMMVSNGNVTGLVDRLVKEGLVERIAVPGDRRANIVRLTEDGLDNFGNMTPVHHAFLHDMLSSIGRQDLEGLYELLGRLKRSIRAAEEAEQAQKENA